MKYLLTILPLLLSMFACEPKEEIVTTDPDAILEFSADTLLFDTVFVSQGSVTKRLKVYNPNERAVRISEIALAGSASSSYNLIINGVQSSLVNSLELRGKDSLYVLVKVNINPTQENLPFLVADSILFRTNGNEQNVKMVAYGQNANFYRKSSIGTTTWTNEKPYVLLDTVLVEEGATLTIEKGTHIYASTKAALLVNGRLVVEGTPDERVVFSGYRREPEYVVAPGQWQGIYVLTKSENNIIRYATISNAINGLQVGNPGKAGTLVEGCEIAYSYLNGIIGFTSDVKVVNTLIHNFGQYGFGGLGGGKYEVLYTTIASYNSRLVRDTPAFVVTDFIPDIEVEAQPIELRLVNSIIYSDSYRTKDEVLIEPASAAIEVANNILRTERHQEQFSQNGNLINVEPNFKAIGKLDFSLDTLSPANGAAKVLLQVLKDFKGQTRSTTNPDIGALERTID
ncbi:hypothetical protein ACFSKU_17045 [Pontibacter silvestris]|uniref:Right handed beta helix domain-containing protein n=1 Tax=Pontibacter silvestris TaxID=2305183 RepID=A0ABW4X0W9_9BACT|nr:hypothetical protein [Pontibacter silvestris]MCC9135731.1 hypothetical protein [Pontibacter silvestris]